MQKYKLIKIGRFKRFHFKWTLYSSKIPHKVTVSTKKKWNILYYNAY